MSHLALVASDGSAASKRLPTVEALDRGVSAPTFSADGKSIRFTVTDDPLGLSGAGGFGER
jgi:hypothetical protein